MIPNLPSIDIFILLTVLISLLLGLIRGATKEILSLVSWFGSLVLTTIAFPYVKNIARANINHGLIADFVTACCLFVLFLSVLSIFNYVCSNFIKNSVLSGIDRFLGAIFGIARGIVVVAIIDVIASQWFIPTPQPEWINNSMLRPHITKIANFVILILPNSIQDTIVSHMSNINKENLLNFITKEASFKIGLLKENRELTKTEAIPANTNTNNTEKEAENLARLKPKENPINEEEHITAPIKTEKEKLDMKRALDAEDVLENVLTQNEESDNITAE